MKKRHPHLFAAGASAIRRSGMRHRLLVLSLSLLLLLSGVSGAKRKRKGKMMKTPTCSG